MNTEIIQFDLIKTKNRLTFDIKFQAEVTRYRGDDDGAYFRFVASNGYEIYSRSRMDIQTERIWLLGAKDSDRSGTMLFASDEKRDIAYDGFMLALSEWSDFVSKNVPVPASIVKAQPFPIASDSPDMCCPVKECGVGGFCQTSPTVDLPTRPGYIPPAKSDPIFWLSQWRGPFNVPYAHVIEAHAENLAISRAETYAVRHGLQIQHGTLKVTPYE